MAEKHSAAYLEQLHVEEIRRSRVREWELLAPAEKRAAYLKEQAANEKKAEESLGGLIEESTIGLLGTVGVEYQELNERLSQMSQKEREEIAALRDVLQQKEESIELQKREYASEFKDQKDLEQYRYMREELPKEQLPEDLERDNQSAFDYARKKLGVAKLAKASENWATMTGEEKLSHLNEWHGALMEGYAPNTGGRPMRIKPLEIVPHYEDDRTLGDFVGMDPLSGEPKRVRLSAQKINESLSSPDGYEETIDTVSHECAHRYQAYILATPEHPLHKELFPLWRRHMQLRENAPANPYIKRAYPGEAAEDYLYEHEALERNAREMGRHAFVSLQEQLGRQKTPSGIFLNSMNRYLPCPVGLLNRFGQYIGRPLPPQEGL
jgi:hypothetical protein